MLQLTRPLWPLKRRRCGETIESLDNALDNAESGSKYIKAGDVRACEENQCRVRGTVQHSVMSEKGCLITLSLDGNDERRY